MVFLTTEQILDRLRELKPEMIKKYRVKEIRLFGSIVRNKQHPDSDIDILAEFEDEADLFDLTGLAIFLEDVFQCRVDVVSRRALRDELKQKILNEAVKL